MKNSFIPTYTLIFVSILVYTFLIPNVHAQVCEDANRVCSRTILCDNNTVLHSSDGCLTPFGCSAPAPEPCGTGSGYSPTVGNGNNGTITSPTPTPTPSPITPTPTPTPSPNPTTPTNASLSCLTQYADVSRAFGVEQCNQNTVEAQYACAQRNMPRLEDISDWRGDCNTGKGNWSTPSGTGTIDSISCSNAGSTSSGSTLSCYTDYASVQEAFGVEQCGYTGNSPTGNDVSAQYACSQRNGPRMEAISAWRGDCNSGKGNWGAAGTGGVSTYTGAAACASTGKGGSTTTTLRPTPPPSTSPSPSTSRTGSLNTGQLTTQISQILNLVDDLITKYKAFIPK